MCRKENVAEQKRTFFFSWRVSLPWKFTRISTFLRHQGHKKKWCKKVSNVVKWYCTLMTGTLGLNLLDSCDSTSASRGWCFNIFLIFMIRTMAACEWYKTATLRLIWKKLETNSQVKQRFDQRAWGPIIESRAKLATTYKYFCSKRFYWVNMPVSYTKWQDSISSSKINRLSPL